MQQKIQINSESMDSLPADPIFQKLKSCFKILQISLGLAWAELQPKKHESEESTSGCRMAWKVPWEFSGPLQHPTKKQELLNTIVANYLCKQDNIDHRR